MATVGACESSSDDDFQCPPPSKKRKGQGKPKNVDARFCSPAKTVEEYEKPFCPGTTKVNTRWAVKTFSDWRIEYNNRHAENPCPEGVLLVDDASVLVSWLQKYVLVTEDGEKYPPKTYLLLYCCVDYSGI